MRWLISESEITVINDDNISIDGAGGNIVDFILFRIDFRGAVKTEKTLNPPDDSVGSILVAVRSPDRITVVVVWVVWVNLLEMMDHKVI